MSERSTWFSGAIAFALLVFITLRFAPQDIQSDIEARASALVSQPGRAWARVIAGARDLSLYGTAPNELAAAEVLRALRAMWGVRQVADHTEVSGSRPSAGEPQPGADLSPRERSAWARRVSGRTCQRLLDGLLSSQSIHFLHRSAVIDARSAALLGHLASVAVHCPQRRLTVAAHTDDIGSGRHSRRLSADRARAVGQYLVWRGVRRERLAVIGYGADRPVADDATPAGRALNRRIEITVEH